MEVKNILIIGNPGNKGEVAVPKAIEVESNDKPAVILN
jgi:hypothetical protein